MPTDVLTTIVNRLNGGPSSEGYVDLTDGNGFIQLSQDGSAPSVIIFGVWESSAVMPQYGGTGVSNSNSSTITLGGSIDFIGAHTFAATLTGDTAVTFPTSGTLVSSTAYPISLANGGTGADLTASNGGIFYSNSTTGAILSGTATPDQILLSGASGAPSWSSATYPATTTINQILYSSAANTITGIAAANSGVLITSAGGVPSISSTLPLAVQTNITEVGTVSAGVWNGTIISATYGGSGVDSPTVHGILIGEGSSPFNSIVLSAGEVLIGTTASDPIGGTIDGTANQITVTSTSGSIIASIPSAVIFPGTVTLNADPATSLEAATKQYVDAVASGLTVEPSVYASTTTNLNAVYVNGVSGVGATLTNAGADAAFSTDGVSPPLNSRILVSQQTAQLQNGIYTVTTIGNGSTPWVLTRATNYDTPAEITPGDFVLINNGNTLQYTGWIQTLTVTTIGTDPISFTQFGASNVVSVNGTTNVITSTGGTNPVIDISAAYVGQTSITTLGTIATGTWEASLIGLAYGGTNADLTASNGGIFYSTASAGAILSGTATADQILMSGSSAAPTWSTATYPSSTTISQLLYSSSANTITGLATANSAVLVTGSTGVPVMSSTMTNGQLIIGSTGATPTAATLTAGTGISITNGAGSITINSTAAAGNWIDQTGTTVTMTINTSYVADNAGLVTLTLPATAAFGSTFEVVGKGAGGWKIAQNAGQQIVFGDAATTSGATGFLASTLTNDTVTIVCITANTEFAVYASIGNLTVN